MTRDGAGEGGGARRGGGAGWLLVSTLAAVACLHLDRLGFDPEYYLATRHSLGLFLGLQLAGVALLLPIAAGRKRAPGAGRAEALARLARWLLPAAPAALVLAGVSAVGAAPLARGAGIVVAFGLAGARAGLLGERRLARYLAGFLALSALPGFLVYLSREAAGPLPPWIGLVSPFRLLNATIHQEIAQGVANLVAAALLAAGAALWTVRGGGGVRRGTRAATGALAGVLLAGGFGGGAVRAQELRALHPFDGWVRPGGITGLEVRITAGAEGFEGSLAVRVAGGEGLVERPGRLLPGGRRVETLLLGVPRHPSSVVVEAGDLGRSTLRLRPLEPGTRVVGMLGGGDAGVREWLGEVLDSAGAPVPRPRIIPLDPELLPPSPFAYEGIDLLVAGGGDAPGAGGLLETMLAARRPLVLLGPGWGEHLQRRGIRIDRGGGGGEGPDPRGVALRAGFTRGWWFPVRGRPRDPGGDRVRELLGDPEARLRDAVLPGGDGRGWGWRGPSLTTLTGIVLLVALAQGLALSLARSQPRVGRIAVPAVPVAALLVLALVRPVPLPFRHEAGAVGLAGRGDRAALLIERHRLVGLADVTVPVASGPLPAGVLREPAPPRGREIPWEALGSGARAGEASLRPGESRVLEIRREAPLPGPPLSVGEGIRSPLGIPLARAWGVRAGRAHPLGSLAPRAPVPDPLPGPGLPLEAIGVGEEGWVRAALDRAAAWAEALAPGERALVGIGAPADTLRLEARAVESRTAPTVWILLLD